MHPWASPSRCAHLRQEPISSSTLDGHLTDTMLPETQDWS